MPVMHLKEPGFIYSVCGPFSKNKKKEFIETGDTRYIYRNELDKACFQHDMIHVDFKDWERKTAPDKILRHKTFNITKNPKYDRYRYQRGFASMV